MGSMGFFASVCVVCTVWVCVCVCACCVPCSLGLCVCNVCRMDVRVCVIACVLCALQPRQAP